MTDASRNCQMHTGTIILAPTWPIASLRLGHARTAACDAEPLIFKTCSSEMQLKEHQKYAKSLSVPDSVVLIFTTYSTEPQLSQGKANNAF